MAKTKGTLQHQGKEMTKWKEISTFLCMDGATHPYGMAEAQQSSKGCPRSEQGRTADPQALEEGGHVQTQTLTSPPHCNKVPQAPAEANTCLLSISSCFSLVEGRIPARSPFKTVGNKTTPRKISSFCCSEFGLLSLDFGATYMTRRKTSLI